MDTKVIINSNKHNTQMESTSPFLQGKAPNPRVDVQNLENPEIIKVKQKELYERAFTTFSLENWEVDQIDSLAELARKNDKKFEPYYQGYTNKRGDDKRNEEDSYNKSTSFIRRTFIEGSPEMGFKEIETIIHPYADDGSLMAHPLVNSVLFYIYQLLPDEMRPGQDRIEVSLINQRASSMPELGFHRDIRRQVFVLVLACNIKELEGAEMSVRDGNRVMEGNKLRVPSEIDIDFFKRLEKPVPLTPAVEDINYHYSNMPSARGNGYLLRENTATTASKEQYIEHRRGAFLTKEPNPERISLRILIDDKGKPVTEAL